MASGHNVSRSNVFDLTPLYRSLLRVCLIDAIGHLCDYPGLLTCL